VLYFKPMSKLLHKLRGDRFAMALVIAMIAVAVALVLVVLLSSGGSTGKQSASVNITITATDRTGKSEQTILVCSSGGSATADGFSLQPPATLCAEARKLTSALTAQLVCPGSYSPLGPEKVAISGTAGPASVKLLVDRNNSCEELRFESVLPILPLATAPMVSTTSKKPLSGYQPPTRNTLLFSLSGRSVIVILAPPVSPTVEAKLSSGPLTLSCAVGAVTVNVITKWSASNKVVVPIPGSGLIKSCKLIIAKAIYSEVTFS